MFSGKVQRQARAANLHSGSGLLGTAESRAGGSRLWAARAGLRLRAGIRKTYSDQHYTLFPAVAWVRRSSHTATPVCVVPCTVPAHSHGPVTPPANPEPSISPKEAPSPSAVSSQPRPPSLVPGSPLPIPWTCHTRGLTPPPRALLCLAPSLRVAARVRPGQLLLVAQGCSHGWCLSVCPLAASGLSHATSQARVRASVWTPVSSHFWVDLVCVSCGSCSRDPQAQPLRGD